MKLIDKSKNRIQGNAIVDSLLTEAWDDTENQYKGADFDGLNIKNRRSELVQLMLEEQCKNCCYCLKELKADELQKKGNITIEHIIPQSIEKEKFNSYLIADELNDHVIHKDDFPRNIKQIPPEKYPHDICYSNLIASCDSTEHCNNLRGNREIKPFIFDRDIESKVVYDAAGLIDCEEYSSSIENIGLDSSNLIIIRKIWRKLSLRIKNPDQITNEKIDVELYSLIDDPDYFNIIETFTPSQQAELKDYHWFYNYYKNI
jgi:hypothetical protein